MAKNCFFASLPWCKKSPFVTDFRQNHAKSEQKKNVKDFLFSGEKSFLVGELFKNENQKAL